MTIDIPGIAVPSVSMPLHTRNWKLWDEEHPWMKKLKGFKGEDPDDFDKDAKANFSAHHMKPVPIDQITSTLTPSTVEAKPDKDRSAEYAARDLHAENVWPAQTHGSRYGVVTFDNQGRVLLREPTNHFDGYSWTFPKGHPDKGEHPLESAKRENVEETGHDPAIVGHIPGGFSGSSTGSTQHYYLAHDTTGVVDPTAVSENGETAHLKWAEPIEALQSISTSTNLPGRYRDLQVLKAAYESYGKLHPEHQFPKITLPPPPPKPVPWHLKGGLYRPNDPEPVAKKSVSYPKGSHHYTPGQANFLKAQQQKAAQTTTAQELGIPEGTKDPWAAVMEKSKGKTGKGKGKRSAVSRVAEMEFRNWTKWHEEHPYVPHPREKGESASDYDKRLKVQYSEWLKGDHGSLEGRKALMFDKPKTDALAKAQLEADKIPVDQRGKAFTGHSAMSDADYDQHRKHVEYETVRHGANDLMHSPFSTHNSEDRVDGAEGAYTPARQKQQQAIIDDIMRKAEAVPNDHQAIIMGGPGGAGKSTILRKNAADPDSTASKLGIKYAHYAEADDPVNHISKGDGIGDPINYVTLNPDDVKGEMARRGMVPNVDHLSPMEAAGPFAHEEASQIVQRVADKLTSQGKNVIWDITLNSEKSGVTRVDALRHTPGGYHIAGAFVDVPLSASDANARARHRHGQDDLNMGKPGALGGRFVPSGVIAAAADKSGTYNSENRAAFERLKAKGTFDHTLTYDNTGHAGKLLEESGTSLATRADLDEMPHESDITSQIKAYRAGEMDLPALTKRLATRTYESPSHFNQSGLNEGDLEDVDRTEPGTWNEVTHAADTGLLTPDEYQTIHTAMCAAHGVGQ